MNDVLDIRLANELPEIERLAGIIRDFGAKRGLTGQETFDITLAFDELLTNTITYGYEAGGRHEIRVTLALEGDMFHGEIRDDGKAFNPLDIPEPNLSLDIDERPIGGLGIFFVRQVMDGLDYRREGGMNIVSLRKTVKRDGKDDGT
jgi:anti-sigma regulatory factor (Ser/Thr protein kinase)